MTRNDNLPILKTILPILEGLSLKELKHQELVTEYYHLSIKSELSDQETDRFSQLLDLAIENDSFADLISRVDKSTCQKLGIKSVDKNDKSQFSRAINLINEELKFREISVETIPTIQELDLSQEILYSHLQEAEIFKELGHLEFAYKDATLEYYQLSIKSELIGEDAHKFNDLLTLAIEDSQFSELINRVNELVFQKLGIEISQESCEIQLEKARRQIKANYSEEPELPTNPHIPTEAEHSLCLTASSIEDNSVWSIQFNKTEFSVYSDRALMVSDKLNSPEDAPPRVTERLFGKRFRLQGAISEWEKLGGSVTIKKTRWKAKKQAAIFAAPQAIPVKPFKILFKTEQAPGEVLLSPEERNLFYDKRTEFKKLCNRVNNSDTLHLSEERNQVRQKTKWLDLSKLATLAINRLRWLLLATLLSHGEAHALPDDDIAKLNPQEFSNDSANQVIRQTSKEFSTPPNDSGPTSPASPTPPESPLSTDGGEDSPSIQDNLIDLGSSNGDISLEVTVTRNAEFDNYIGFYRVEDEQLRVRDPLTGALLSPGDPGYREAALGASIDDLLITVENGDSTNITASIDEQLLGLFIAIDVGMEPNEVEKYGLLPVMLKFGPGV